MRKGLQIIPPGTTINFMGMRHITFIITAIMVFGTVFGVYWNGLRYGIDFRGGYVMEIRTHDVPDLQVLRHKLADLKLGEIALQNYGSPRDILLKVVEQEGSEQAQKDAIAKIKHTLGPNVDYRRLDVVGPKVGAELLRDGIYAVVCALLAMLVYIWFRFEWQFGVCAIVSLIHDCVSIVGMYAFSSLEFGNNAIVAILITASYSINDTVVIYDRIRENLQKYRKMSMFELLNLSINETLSRTVLTSSTVLLSLAVLYFFGGGVIASFSLPILIGIAVGTYSSIFFAAPLLLYFSVPRMGEDSKAN